MMAWTNRNFLLHMREALMTYKGLDLLSNCSQREGMRIEYSITKISTVPIMA